MTLVVALLAEDGVVVASDTAAFMEVGTEEMLMQVDCRIIYKLGEHSIFSASGDEGMVQLAIEAIKPFSKELDNGLVPSLRERILEALSSAIIPKFERIKLVDEDLKEPEVEMLLVVRDEQGNNRLWAINGDGSDWFENEYGFACFGSCNTLAMSFLKNFSVEMKRHGRDITKLDTLANALIAYRVVKDTIRSGLSEVGGEVDIWRMGKDGVVSQLSKDELNDELQAACNLWLKKELVAFEDTVAVLSKYGMSLPSIRTEKGVRNRSLA